MLSTNIAYSFSNASKKMRYFPHMFNKPKALARVYPNQYPKNITDPVPSMIEKTRPVRFTTPKDEVIEQKDIPNNVYASTVIHKGQWKSP